MLFGEGRTGGNDISDKDETGPEANSVFGVSVHSVNVKILAGC